MRAFGRIWHRGYAGGPTGPWVMIYKIGKPKKPIGFMFDRQSGYGWGVSVGVRRLRHGLIVGWIYRKPRAA